MARNAKTRNRTARSPTSAKRWLLLPVGIALAVGALYGLARLPAREAPSGHIDDASRAELERVLREADGEARR